MSHDEIPEISMIINSVDDFARQMKAKLIHKFLVDGRRGWRELENLPEITAALQEHCTRPLTQAIDVANFAMMVWRIMDKNKHRPMIEIAELFQDKEINIPPDLSERPF